MSPQAPARPLRDRRVDDAGHFQHLFVLRQINYGYVWFTTFGAHIRLVVHAVAVPASLLQRFKGTVSGVGDSLQHFAYSGFKQLLGCA